MFFLDLQRLIKKTLGFIVLYIVFYWQKSSYRKEKQTDVSITNQ